MILFSYNTAYYKLSNALCVSFYDNKVSQRFTIIFHFHQFVFFIHKPYLIRVKVRILVSRKSEE